MGELRGPSLVAMTSSALLCAGLLTGCSDSAPGPTSLPSPTKSVASVTPKPSPTGAKAEVEATVREFYAALDIAMRTGNTDRYVAATDDGCNCREFVRVIDRNFEPGRFVGAGARLMSINSLTVHNGSAIAGVTYEVLPYAEVVNGATTTAFPRRVRNVSVGLIRIGQSRWKVTSTVEVGASS